MEAELVGVAWLLVNYLRRPSMAGDVISKIAGGNAVSKVQIQSMASKEAVVIELSAHAGRDNSDCDTRQDNKDKETLWAPKS